MLNPCKLSASLGIQDESKIVEGTPGMVTVFSDSNKKCLSTDFIREEAVKKNYLSRPLLHRIVSFN